jgi:Domain of unknown function (DUF6487)
MHKRTRRTAAAVSEDVGSMTARNAMRCPNCNAEMESGHLRLTGIGGTWFLFPGATAKLTFNSDVLLATTASVLSDQQSRNFPAFRCRVCQMISFQYVVPVKAPEPAVIPRIEPVPGTGVV